MESGHGGADGQAGKSQFGDRRIDDAPGAEFFQKPLADLKGALIIGDIFADQEDLLVAPHLLPQSFVERFPIGKGHCTRPPWAGLGPPCSPCTRPPWASIALGPPLARGDRPFVPSDPPCSPVNTSSARAS